MVINVVPSHSVYGKPMRLHAVSDLEFLIGLRSNQPLSRDQIRAAKEAISRLTADDLEHAGLGPPPMPVLTEEVHKLPGPERLEGLQTYISSFQYNFDHGYHFNISKRRPFNEIMNTARAVAHAGLPIKCIEAVFLGLYITSRHSDWIRFPVGFKTVVLAPRMAYRHIVLVIYDTVSKLWGCLGLSRKKNLMFKPLQYKSLSQLMTDFKRSFAVWNHQIVKIRVGLPAVHNVFSTAPVVWRSCNLKVTDQLWHSVCDTLDTINPTERSRDERNCGLESQGSLVKHGRSDSIQSLRHRTTSSVSCSGIWASNCSDSEDDINRRRSRSSFRRSRSNNPVQY